MDKFIIEGGKPLLGSVRVQGAKNAALPILAASLLAEGTHVIHDVPRLLDVDVMIDILRALGAKVIVDQYTLTIDTTSIHSTMVPEELMGKMRSSIFLMGPLLARFKEVSVSRPGGCAIGERKIDLHQKGLESLGAKITEYGDQMICKADQLFGNHIELELPSVGATENIMMAAVLANGTTKIVNAAREPEICDLQNYLNKMGAKVSGAGTSEIIIEGVEKLQPVTYQIIPDRIFAGTMMVAVGITGGSVQLENVIPEQLTLVINNLTRAGVEIDVSHDIIIVKRSQNKLNALERIITTPYPGFPTDMQAQFMALLTTAVGTSSIQENVFDGRFRHAQELINMGANIKVDKNIASIFGVRRLHGAKVDASDLRAGAALVLAGLGAEGITTVNQVHHIDRGYENFEKTLITLGASIRREKV